MRPCAVLCATVFDRVRSSVRPCVVRINFVRLCVVRINFVRPCAVRINFVRPCAVVCTETIAPSF